MQHILARAHYRDLLDPRNSAPMAGSPGQYKVVFTLSRPAFPLLPENKHEVAERLTGSSHLALCSPALVGPPDKVSFDQLKIQCEADGQQFTFIGLANQNGYLHKIVIEKFYAVSFEDAETRAYRYLAPSLSNWSIHLDVPFHIYQVDVSELSTGHYRWSILNPYQEVAFRLLPIATMSEEFRRCASLYRDALNSNTPIYQFLCFFKIIEGVQAHRNRKNKEAVENGKPIKKHVEAIPSNKADYVPWLKAIFHSRPDWDGMSLDLIFLPEALGKKCNAVIEKYLRPLRVQIAHAITNAGELTLSSDEAFDVQKVNRWLPLERCIVRRMLKNEFPDEFLSFLGEDGSVKG